MPARQKEWGLRPKGSSLRIRGPGTCILMVDPLSAITIHPTRFARTREFYIHAFIETL